jgi:uncharacterized protein (TIGR02246 family)
MNWLFTLSLLFTASGFAQTRWPGISDRFENLDFAQGAAGAMPPGWRLGPSGSAAYIAQIAAGASCHAGKQCGVVRSIGPGPHERCFLYQNVDATPYRGKVLVFRAASRVTGGGLARLVVRVHRPDNSSTFFDNLGDHPIQSAQWDAYQIVFPVDGQAEDIEFGIQLYGEGTAWIDQIYMSSPIIEAEKEIRELFRKFNAAREVIDGHAMAETYSETGEYISLWQTRVAGRTNLEGMWSSSITGKSKRTILRIDVLTPEIAVVHGRAEFDNPDERPELEEVFMLVKEGDAWKIRVHQAMRP